MDVLHNLKFKGSGPVLEYVTEFPSSPDEGQMALKDGIVYCFTTIENVLTWYPLSGKTTHYIHNQGLLAVQWNIEHNLGTTDLIYFIYNENGKLIEANLTPVDNNSFKIDFTVAKKGKVVVFAAGTTLGTSGDIIESPYFLPREVNSTGTINDNELIICATTGEILPEESIAYTLSLPSSPVNLDIIKIIDRDSNAQHRPVALSSTHLIDNSNEDFVLDVDNFSVELIFLSSTNAWTITSN